MSNKEKANLWSANRQQKSVKQVVVYELIDAMLDGRLPVDRLMPPENEMCRRLSVSRVAFREAVKQLEIFGFLRIERGNGTMVTKPTFTCNEPIIEFLGKSGAISLEELHQLRLLIEVEIVELVAGHHEEDLLARLQKNLDEVERNFNRKSSHIDLDYEFHQIIIDACPNRIYPLVLSPFNSQLYKSRKISFKSIAAARKTFETHRAILDAIMRKDPKGAAAIMSRHLEATADDLGIETDKRQFNSKK
ncbi:MAG TPA: hypothetical protein DET40_20265 [Lentisphaeria bacterium]|nr:MAG: hypothetical protein A2X45_16495 [Lentisphaerae bacterium GWF2_50_93]HCE45887.1 hypothetical protein [Lentisphaeria bacterium]